MTIKSEVCHIVGTFRLPEEGESSLTFESDVAKLWQELPDSLRSATFHHQGCDVLVSVDWQPVIQILNEQLRTSVLVKESPKKLTKNWHEVYFTECRLVANVEIKGQNNLSDYEWYPGFFVESYLYDLFVILNLAFPGSADFLNTSVESKGARKGNRLELSAYNFEHEYHNSAQWPTLRILDPKVVAKWHHKVRKGVNQLPENSVERALFALLHVSRSSGRPEDIIWIFYSFEALFQTRVGENYAALIERITLLLQPNQEQEKELRKRLRSMYDYRSAFVHGGLQIIHPMHQEVIDRRVDEKYSTTLDLSQFGTRLLLACLQRCIDEDWEEIKFKTVIETIDTSD